MSAPIQVFPAEPGPECDWRDCQEPRAWEVKTTCPPPYPTNVRQSVCDEHVFSAFGQAVADVGEYL